eukprot:TRINITY_DN6059_c0_g1_i1.p1 TRINITY_DN6059_c0_g1~~TRINITY_DN6059_c0_g1_i1.p1  ORF type:complete len:342 (-),score=58.73 TRINITY_DN6059_c0_g1_i1:52-1005(-)
MASAPRSPTPLFTFGIVADPQYADVEDGWDFRKTAKRRYRNSLNVMSRARAKWQSEGANVVLQLGDIIDGLAKEENGTISSTIAVNKVLAFFEGFKTYHLIGNHELYNFTRDEMASVLNNRTPTGESYYSFSPTPGWRFVALDSFELSVLNGDGPQKDEADKFLKKHNPNDVTSKSVDWVAGLVGPEKRFVPYNGGMGAKQLEFVENTLAEAAAKNERVILLSHTPVCPGSCGESCLLWNYEELLAIIRKHGTCVEAYFSGHDHFGGYHLDEDSGVRFITFPSPMIAKGDDCFAVGKFYEDRVVIEGYGMDSYTWDL